MREKCMIGPNCYCLLEYYTITIMIMPKIKDIIGLMMVISMKQ